MSTRSVIAIQRGEDEYEAIYCHSDGYLTYNGAMLLDHYSDRDKVERLLKLGDLSCLERKIDPEPNLPHTYDYNNRQDDVCVAYGRDRGDTNIESRTMNLEKLLKWAWIEYFYVFDQNGDWKYYKYSDVDIRDVKEDLEKEYKALGIKRPKNFYGFWTDTALKEEKKRQQNQDSEM